MTNDSVTIITSNIGMSQRIKHPKNIFYRMIEHLIVKFFQVQ